MKEQPDKARVVFGCGGCAARADVEAALVHEDKPHTKKTVRICTKSGTVPHAIRPAGTGVTKDGRFTERWYGVRVKKADGFTMIDAKKLTGDNLAVMVDKEGKDTFMVQVDPKHGARTLEEITKVCHAQIKSQVAEIKDPEEIDIAGGKAVRIVYEVAGKARRRVTQIYAKHDGNFVIFSATDVEPFDNHAKAFKELFDSIELLK